MTFKRIVFFALAAAVVGVAARVTAKRGETLRTVCLSATDAKGAPITDLTAADLAVKENGQDRTISSLKEATGPIEIAMVVDDGGSGIFQVGVLQVIQTFGEQGLYSIRRFNPQAAKILDYTPDVGSIQAALDKIGGRGKISGDGEQLLEAISETAKELQQRKAARRSMLVLTTGGEGQPRNPTVVMDELASSGVVLHVVHTTAAKIGLVTGDGPRQSGGRIERVGAASAVPAAITKITDALMHQYVLTYTLPDGVKPSDRLSVTTNRKGVTLMAPQRIPDK
jgi:hypothetical protein